MKNIVQHLKHIDHLNTHEVTGVVARIRGLSYLLGRNFYSETDREFIVDCLYTSAQEITELNSKLNQVYSELLSKSEALEIISAEEVLDQELIEALI